ncbi:tyrosine-type recombinase/integrase [Jeotgalibacillus proteolyticus]|uniref:Site-specific integrase n=1 Tax=Jeotgalibacillus proteolyticus TaxID=2082395 RepID=A0A2S5G9W4_9BACL|nr:tyrosine-type recombinase/integrase [Jeotgalibacillus proteolyticus]PPA69711.1 site-specific integrase [Jeotgalibacillus proteolyticus]
MEVVNPIKNIRHISMMKKELKMYSSRDYCFFVLGINTGLRINVLLQLETKQVIDEEKKILAFIDIDGQKIYMNDKVKAALAFHLHQNDHLKDQYLFQSPKSGTPITRQHAYRVIHETARKVGIDYQIGTHTLRKTFGYHAYIKGIAISLIQERYHHATPAETLRYIGIDDTFQKIDVNL